MTSSSLDGDGRAWWRRSLVAPSLLAASLALAAGCCGPTPAYPNSPQWRDGRFRNPGGSVEPGVLALLKRTLAPSARGHQPEFHPPRVVNDGALLREGRLSPSVTWIGHATTLIQVGGWNVLTDPIYAARLFNIPRRAAPGVALEDLPPIDVVLLSHDHADHLDTETIRALRDRPHGERTRFVAPLGVGAWLRGQKIKNVVELDWWQATTVRDEHGSRDPLAITVVPALHWSRRCATDGGKRLWGGFVIEHPDLRAYFAGDTGYGPHFTEIAARFPRLDLALLPIGAYAPRPYMSPKHMAPEQAAQAFRDLGARFTVPIHWGTFRLGDEPMDEPPALFRASLGAGAPRAPFVYVLPIGGILRLPLERNSPTRGR